MWGGEVDGGVDAEELEGKVSRYFSSCSDCTGGKGKKLFNEVTGFL